MIVSIKFFTNTTEQYPGALDIVVDNKRFDLIKKEQYTSFDNKTIYKTSFNIKQPYIYFIKEN